MANPNLFNEIKEALRNVTYGSIEIFVQNKVITQITVRNIKKTSVDLETETNGANNRTFSV